MRVYLPISPTELSDEELDARTVYALTSALRAALPEEDEEGGETSAYLAAADAAVELAGDAGRRLVVAADVPDRDLAPVRGTDEHPGALTLRAAVPWRSVASLHVDEVEAAVDVRAAAAGDADALERSAERDLLWYDTSERAELVAEFA